MPNSPISTSRAGGVPQKKRVRKIMKAKNPRPLPKTPSPRDCEDCGKKTFHDFFLLMKKQTKFYVWRCRKCGGGTLEPTDKFEPN
jgi:transcription elongation factor Elf1